MAFSTKHFFLLFLLTFLFSNEIYAREHKFFSKIPRINSYDENTKSLSQEAKEIEKQELGPLYEAQKGPEFIPENFNGGGFSRDGTKSQKYASFGYNNVVNGVRDKTTIIPDIDRSSLPYNNGFSVASLDQPVDIGVRDKTTVTPDIYRAYLPYDNGDNVDLAKYNTESYVTDQPEGNNGNTAKVSVSAARIDHYGGKMIYDRNTNINNNNDDNYDDAEALVKQGMSDTRFMKNGKYYYDFNSEKNGVDSYGKNARFDYKNYGVNGGYYGNQENIPFDGYKKNKAQFEDFKFNEGFN